MVSSMTAFARQVAEGDWGKATWELRSVNHRFLDVSLRLPEDLRGLEGAVRERLAAKLKRGKVDCTLRYEPPGGGATRLTVNDALLDAVIAAAQDVAARLPQSTPLAPLDLLRWPGVIDTADVDAERIGAAVLQLLDAALEELVATRTREGEKLKGMLSSRCELARGESTRLRARMPEILAEYDARLRARVAELLTAADPGRIEQEVALLAAKIDVAEELDRLEAHLEEVARVLADDDAIGRRLDFLMQELHREANTLGSKSAHLASTAASVELKVLIEQMREQVQNIE